MKGGAIVEGGGAEGEEILVLMSAFLQACSFCRKNSTLSLWGLTSAVLGTDSQKTSILMSPRAVWRVTDMAVGKPLHGPSLHDVLEERWGFV